jgi:hypothetical protein
MIMNTREFIEIEEHFGAHNYHPLDVILARGEGYGYTILKAGAIWIA